MTEFGWRPHEPELPTFAARRMRDAVSEFHYVMGSEDQRLEVLANDHPIGNLFGFLRKGRMRWYGETPDKRPTAWSDDPKTVALELWRMR